MNTKESVDRAIAWATALRDSESEHQRPEHVLAYEVIWLREELAQARALASILGQRRGTDPDKALDEYRERFLK